MKRLQIMDALKTALQAAFPGAAVEYWRDRPVVSSDVPCVVLYRDTGGQFTKVNTEHEHRVRVEVEVMTFTGPIGQAMNENLDALVRAIGADPSLGQGRVVCELIAFAHDIAGDGFDSGVCRLSMDVVYRTKAWEGV